MRPYSERWRVLCAFFFTETQKEPDAMAHTSPLSIWKFEAGELPHIPGQPGLESETLSQSTQANQLKNHKTCTRVTFYGGDSWPHFSRWLTLPTV